MNTAQLKTYAPAARLAFIAAVTARATRFGVTADGAEEPRLEGDVLLVGGRAFPRSLAEPRKRLVERVRSRGFAAVMEAAAYTWFNRLVALRYMELHGYLDHGYRVLSHPDGLGRPELLDHAADLELPGLDRARVVELVLDGAQDEELYRLLLQAQCNALHEAMPFLFERIGEEIGLLLPDNLLHTDSLIRRLVDGVDEEAWERIEIVGWLYQFYISEKKDKVIGKVVRSEDIPAATQLFTPDWIVKYLVSNSLGAQWLATYPDSPLKGQMPYYVEPAKQTPEVEAQLAATTPSALNPEELRLIDPACGSGHILVEAYDQFKAIYLERGYRPRDVPELILNRNLYGLDIDERAAQLSGFALMMKGRADDRRLFRRGVKLNVMALRDSGGLATGVLAGGVRLTDFELELVDLERLRQLFEHATTFGSLIEVPEEVEDKLPGLRRLVDQGSRDLFVAGQIEKLRRLVRQAEVLAGRYFAVVANPPYMGTGGMCQKLKKYVKTRFATANSDLFACFIARGCTLAQDTGHCAMVTMQSWMFLSSFQELREQLLRKKTFTNMAHLGARAFGSISGEVVQTTAFSLRNRWIGGYRPLFIRLLDGSEDEKRAALLGGEYRLYITAQDELLSVPGCPVAYWASKELRQVFRLGRPLMETAAALRGVETGNNERFLRQWPEVSWASVGIGCDGSDAIRTWYPYNKGGGFRKWFGNRALVVNWRDGGDDIKNQTYPRGGRLPWRAANEAAYFSTGLTWGGLTSGPVTFRLCDYGAVFDSNKGSMMFPPEPTRMGILALLNSRVAESVLSVLNPTISTQKDDIGSIPWIGLEPTVEAKATGNSMACVDLARADERSGERSWDFRSLPILDPTSSLESAYSSWLARNHAAIAEMKHLEEQNNRLFIDAYGLQNEVNPEVPIEQITLTINPAYRYGIKLSESERDARFAQDTIKELVSYAVGCMMGRYSLDEPGLVYADSGGVGFDPSRYATFTADEDGIVPLTDTHWFDDDALVRLVEFVGVAWDGAHLEDNLSFMAGALGSRRGESSRDTLRRYLCDRFFKDHLQTYKSRPIYWLFTSGRHKALQCLVYLHRYNPGTLSRLRAEYVIPLQGRIAARLERLDEEIKSSKSTAHNKRLGKEKARLERQRQELISFDEELRHYSDKRIALDLDDGVKVNYGRFGDLLAEVKKVHGKEAVAG